MRIINADDIVYEYIDSTYTGREESYYGTGIIAVRKEDIDEMPTIELPERENEPVGCNGCKYDWFGDPRCSKCARSFQDHYEADMKGDDGEND